MHEVTPLLKRRGIDYSPKFLILGVNSLVWKRMSGKKSERGKE